MQCGTWCDDESMCTLICTAATRFPYLLGVGVGVRVGVGVVAGVGVRIGVRVRARIRVGDAFPAPFLHIDHKRVKRHRTRHLPNASQVAAELVGRLVSARRR